MFHDLYDFKVSTLGNGLTVHCKEWPRASWFYMGVVVHAGAREDSVGRAGLAHMVEHLVGENIPDLTFAQLEKRFKDLGGYGWFGHTSYLASTYKFHLPNEEQGIQTAIHLFGEMLVAPKQLTRSIDEEKAVILREYHREYQHEQAYAWALQGRPFLFAQHPRLGSFHSVLGIPDEFLDIAQEEIQAFYDRYYVPQNISLVCIGSIPQQKIFHLLHHSPFIEQLPGQRNRIPAPFFPQPPQRHEQIIHMSKFSQLARSEASLSFEWVLPTHFERRCVQIFCNLFEEVLLEALRYKAQLTYHVDVEHTYYQDCRVLSITLKTHAAERVQDIFWQVLRSIPHQAEEKFLEIKQDTLSRIYRMDYSGYDLLESAMDDLEDHQRLISFREEIEQIQRVTYVQVAELAGYLTYERHFCFVILP